MKSWRWLVWIAIASLPVVAQSAKDPNLRRARSSVSTVSPQETPHPAAGSSNAQLDQLEHQTARIVSQPGQGQPKAQSFKYRPPAEPHSQGFQQSMPLHAPPNGSVQKRPNPSPHPGYPNH